MDLLLATHPGYQSYLVRLWRDGTRRVWHASAQSAASEQPIYFATVEELFAFLAARLAPDPDTDVPEATAHAD